MMDFTLHHDIDAIDRGAWDACFGGDPESWDYHRAVARAGIAGFSWMFPAVRHQGRVVLAAPAFATTYRLDTTVQGWLKAALAPFARWLSLRLFCLGSPAADRCHLGFAPDLSAAERACALGVLLDGFAAAAAEAGAGLLALKDLADEDWRRPEIHAVLVRAGYRAEASLPNAMLDLGMGDEERYLAGLSKATRKDVRRKLRASMPRMRIDLHRGEAALGMVDAMMALYDVQRARSGVDFEQFEALSPAYFANVLTGLGERALVFSYWYGDDLAGFNLCLAGDTMLIDKFIGLRDDLARELDLYVVSWMVNVRHCLAHGIARLQTGQTAYAMKTRMGSRLEPRWLVFRHRSRLINAMLGLVAPLLAADRWDGDLEDGS